MSKKQRLNTEELFKRWQKIDLYFPVCLKTKQGQIFRYLDDGRYEMIEKTKSGISCLLFGKVEYDWHDEDKNWLRIIVGRNENGLITNEEFQSILDEIITEGYAKYLEGDIKNEKADTTGIVLSENTQEEMPF